MISEYERILLELVGVLFENLSWCVYDHLIAWVQLAIIGRLFLVEFDALTISGYILHLIVYRQSISP